VLCQQRGTQAEICTCTTSSSVRLDRIACRKIFARYELFKLVQDVPGDIVECGVFRGSGVYTWVKLLCLFERLKLIAGDVAATTREYARSQLGARIALLYLDLDNYEGTLACLRNLYPLVSPGGVVAFDEYALAGYGESDAVDEFFRGQKIRLRSFPWARTPMAFLVKEAA
jgi:Macrocin-O-methyltransferase (TylF)